MNHSLVKERERFTIVTSDINNVMCSGISDLTLLAVILYCYTLAILVSVTTTSPQQTLSTTISPLIRNVYGTLYSVWHSTWITRIIALILQVGVCGIDLVVLGKPCSKERLTICL